MTCVYCNVLQVSYLDQLLHKKHFEPVRKWQSPMASDSVKLSLQIVPQHPARNISTLPTVRELESPPFLDTNLADEVTVWYNCKINLYRYEHVMLICKLILEIERFPMHGLGM